MRLVPRMVSALVLAVALAGAACSKCGDQGGEDASARALEPPVPAPDKLLADVYVGSPNTSWGKLQRGVGGAVGILPASAGGIVCAMAGLDPAVGSEIDGTAPVYGVVAGDPAAPGFAIAMKLFDLRKARGVLVDGETARYAARDVAGMTELVPKGEGGRGEGARSGSAEGAPQLAVGLTKGSYLVVARSSDDLAKLGPYVTRTLPTRPLPDGGAIVVDVPRASIASVLKPKLSELWEGAKAYLLAEDVRMRRDRGGRAPDFGEPAAIVGAVDAYAAERIAVLGDLEKMRIGLDVVDDGVVIDAAMIPVSGSGPARVWTDSMTTGDTGPLSTLPATSAVSVLLRDTEQTRAEQLRSLEQAVTTSLGSRLAEGDGKKVHDMIAEWTKAGPSVLSGALLWEGTGQAGLVVLGAMRESDAATSAMKGTIDLLRVAPFKDLLHVKDVTAGTEELNGIGKVSLATVAREPAKGKVAPAANATASKKDAVAVAWLTEKSALSIATAEEPLSILRAGVRPDKKIADDPAIARPLAALGATASSIILVQPLRFDPKRAHLPAAPLVIALGRKDRDAFLRIDISNGVLRELARWQIGL